MKAAAKRTGKRLRAALAHRRAAFRARIGWWLGRGPRPLRILLVSDGENYTSEEQFAPIRRHARALGDRLGLVVRFMTPARAMALSGAALRRYAVLGLKLGFRTEAGEARRIAEHFRSVARANGSRLVYFDGDDDLSVAWPELVEICDLYLKKHVYADRADYEVARIGKSNLTDHVARHHGYSFADNEIPASRPVPADLVGKIAPGWNIGLDDKIARLATRLGDPVYAARPYDVCGRAVAAPTDWIFPLRDPVMQVLDGLQGELNVLVPRGRVSQEAYYQEMMQSKICISPFGYGEICWRDFEAILCGCLVIKPDMGHVETSPNIFRPHETYVPVEWDYSDLAEQCRRYAADDAARIAIATRARAVLLEGLTADFFVGRMEAVLDQAGVPAGR